MGIFKKIFKGKAKDDIESPFSPTSGTNLFTPNIDPYYSPYDAAFRSTSFSCLKLRAEAMASLDYQFNKQIRENEFKELPYEHWLPKLFRQPNPDFRKKEFFRLIQYYIDLNGNAFIYTPLNGLKYPTQMWILQSSSVKLIFGDKKLSHYEYMYQGTTLYFPQEEVIHIRNILPGVGAENEYIGTSLVSLAINSLGADKELESYLRRYLSNDTIPPVVLEMPVGTTIKDEAFSLFKTRWNLALPQHKILAALNDGMKANPLSGGGLASTSNSIKDIDNILQRRISTIYGIPYSRLTGENTTYASAKLADFTFRVDTIEPLAIDITEAFTNHFRQYEDDIFIDFEKFRYIDEEKLIREREFNLSHGLTTINEERAKLGLESIENGDVLFMQSGLIPLKSVISGNTPQQLSLKKGEGVINKDIKLIGPSEEFKVKYWTKYNKLIDDNSEAMLKDLKPMFKELEDIVISNLYDGNKSYTMKDLDTDILFSLDDLNELINKHLSGSIEKQVLDTMKEASNDVSLKWNDVQTNLEREISRNISRSLDRVSTIEEGLRSSLTRVITTNQSASIGELSDLLSESFTDYSGKNAWKAERIAQTTNTYISNQSQMTVWREYGIKYSWLTQRDGKVRPSHSSMDGEVVGDNGIFSNGVDAPGNFGRVEEDINCRCILIPTSIN